MIEEENKTEESTIDLSAQKLEIEACEHIRNLYSSWSDYWKPIHDHYKVLYDEYSAQTNVLENGNVAKVKPSLLFSIVETLVSEMYSAFYDETPYLLSKPTKEADVESSEIVTEYTQHQINSNGMKIDSIPFLRSFVLYSLAWSFIPWEYTEEFKRREQDVLEPVLQQPFDQFGNPLTDDKGNLLPPSPVMDPITGAPQMRPVIGADGKIKKQKVWMKEVTSDIWKYETLEPWDVVADPKIKSPADVRSKGQGVIIVRHFSKCDLKKMERDGVYENVDLYFDLREFKKSQTDSPKFQNEGKDHNEDTIRVLQFWGKFPVQTIVDDQGNEKLIYVEDGEEVECVIDVPDDYSTSFRIKRCPIDEQIRPIICAGFLPQAGKIYNEGPLHIIYSEYQVYKEFVNSRLTNLNQHMNPMWFARLGALTNLKNLKYVPNKIIRTGNPTGDISPVPTPGLGETYSQDLGMIQMEMQETTSALKASQKSGNMGQAFARTAAGINFFEQRIASRLGIVVDTLEYYMMGGLFEIVHAYNKQFLTDPTDFEAIGKQNVYLTIHPEAYMTKKSWKPVGAGSRLKRGEQIQILDRMLAELKSYSNIIDIEKIIMKMVKLTGLFTDPAEIMLSPEKQKQIQANQKPDVKESMSLSVNYDDLPVSAKLAIIQGYAPQSGTTLEEILHNEQRRNGQGASGPIGGAPIVTDGRMGSNQIPT